MEQEIKVEFVSHGRKAKCPPNPEYPNGKDVDATNGESGVWVELPYPAKECGVFVVSGPHIKKTVITAAGRPDDPRNVKIAYKEQSTNDH